MLDIRGLDIYISRGDTETLVVDFECDVPPDNTQVIMTLKRYPNNSNALWVKNAVVKNGSFTVRFSSSDTNFTPSIYKYDIKLVYEDGEIYTPMLPADFHILEVVGDV